MMKIDFRGLERLIIYKKSSKWYCNTWRKHHMRRKCVKLTAREQAELEQFSTMSRPH